MSRKKESKCVSGTFVSQLSPITGVKQWNLVESEYDFEQEVARSAYADMLHDSDRNKKYCEAIKYEILRLKSLYPGRPVRVLDIGTGTGILSMMAIRAGADFVTACEEFVPVAKCARRIIAANGLSSFIRVISKRSTELSVGKDMPHRANLLIAELFDSELIGEGVLDTFQHAAAHLLTTDAVFIPCSAKLYFQIVESPFLWSHQQLVNSASLCTKSGFSSVFPTPSMKDCSGCPSVFDLQISRLNLESNNLSDQNIDSGIRCLLDEPIEFHSFVFGPAFANISLKKYSRITSFQGQEVKSIVDGCAHAVVVWWSLQMEPLNKVDPIDMAPSWATKAGVAPLREHWMQAVYFPLKPLVLAAGEAFGVDFAHDSVSMWFDLVKYPPGEAILPAPSASLVAIERPLCSCSVHVAWPRSRIAELSSGEYAATMGLSVDLLDERLKALTPDSVVVILVVSDASLMPLRIAEYLDSRRASNSLQVHLLHMDVSFMSARLLRAVYQDLAERTGFQIELFETVKQLVPRLEALWCLSPFQLLILAEPFTIASTLPWNSLNFWYTGGLITYSLPDILPQLLFPTRLRIMAIAVDFEHLWKIRAPVGGACEGFDLTQFDDLVLSAAQASDAPVEPQPLWEYAGLARSPVQAIFDLSMERAPVFSSRGPLGPESDCLQTRRGDLPLTSPSVNGVAFWCEWLVKAQRGGDLWRRVSAPSLPIRPDNIINWSRTGAQNGVLLLSPELTSALRASFPCSLSLSVDFNFHTGEPSFDITVQPGGS